MSEPRTTFNTPIYGGTIPRRNANPGGDKRKQSLYFPEEMLKEMQAEAERQDRSLSWIVQHAWRVARSEVGRFPAAIDYTIGR